MLYAHEGYICTCPLILKESRSATSQGLDSTRLVSCALAEQLAKPSRTRLIYKQELLYSFMCESPLYFPSPIKNNKRNLVPV